MRNLPLILTALITCALVVVLDSNMGSVPALGRFLSPQHGFWKNAEPTDKDYSGEFDLQQLNGSSTVYFDDRMVPHVFAGSEGDAYFIQGYLHAKFRLWQMEMQTYAAAGRISEVAGKRALQFDR